MERALSAPSKLFLCGEYAVLWGGAARVLAVGPRAEALVRAGVKFTGLWEDELGLEEVFLRVTKGDTQ